MCVECEVQCFRDHAYLFVIHFLFPFDCIVDLLTYVVNASVTETDVHSILTTLCRKRLLHASYDHDHSYISKLRLKYLSLLSLTCTYFIIYIKRGAQTR